MPFSAAASKNGMAPKRFPWSVMARAGMPRLAACSTISSSFCAPSRSEYCEWLCRWTKRPSSVIAASLLPLDGGGGLARDVVHHPVDAAHLVDDARADARQELVRQARPVGGHEVVGGHGAQRADVLVRPAVSHDAHRLHRQQDDESLRRRVVQRGSAQLLDEDGVGPAQEVE